MAEEMYGNFEVDTSRGWVRLRCSELEDDYEYIVDPNNFTRGKDSILATKAFIKGYDASRQATRRQFKELLNT